MMPGLLAMLFLEPIAIHGSWRLVMLVPLSLAIAVVYKTIRCREVRDIPAASAVLCLTMVFGMLAIGVALLVVFRLMA